MTGSFRASSPANSRSCATSRPPASISGGSASLLSRCRFKVESAKKYPSLAFTTDWWGLVSPVGTEGRRSSSPRNSSAVCPLEVCRGGPLVPSSQCAVDNRGCSLFVRLCNLIFDSWIDGGLLKAKLSCQNTELCCVQASGLYHHRIGAVYSPGADLTSSVWRGTVPWRQRQIHGEWYRP